MSESKLGDKIATRNVAGGKTSNPKQENLVDRFA
jgi:hypothetical protein